MNENTASIWRLSGYLSSDMKGVWCVWLQNGKKDSPFGDNPMNIQLKRFQVTVVIVVVGVEQTFS